MGEMIHDLKTWPIYFEEVVSDHKRFEIRRYDRPFRVGDYLELLEYDPDSATYSGRKAMRRVTYVLGPGGLGLQDGFVVMSIERCGEGR